MSKKVNVWRGHTKGQGKSNQMTGDIQCYDRLEKNSFKNFMEC